MTITGNIINGANYDAINCGSASGTVTIEANEIYNAGGSGILGRADTDDITIQKNTIHSCFAGVTIQSGCTGVTINWNNIAGNTVWGVENRDTYELDAENNWWGHASGPSGEDGRVNRSGKVIGKGDAVSANVDWDPWLPQPVGHTKHDPVPPGLLD